MKLPGSELPQLPSIADGLAQIAAADAVEQVGAFIIRIAQDMGFQAAAGGMLTGPKAQSKTSYFTSIIGRKLGSICIGSVASKWIRPFAGP